MKIKILIPVLLLFLSTFTALEAQNKIEVNSKAVSTMLQKDNKLIVLDVRNPEEYIDGHIKGAININILQDDAFGKIDKLNRNAKYIVYCRTSHRSGIAVDHMMKSGFKTVYQMMDGFPGWAANKLPVQK
jgi:rhodanese-related sulfurtransferase